MLTTKLRWTASLALLGIIAFVAGCGGGDSATTESAGSANSTSVADTADHDDHGHEEVGEHDGWWCNEHGVPEGECAQCDASLIAGFKAKKDWCEKHNRPDSQCFVCDASRADRFIARYEAKFGKQPPTPEEEGDEK
jgi:hypothetical protein